MTQPGSPEASSVCEQIMKLAIGEQDGETNRTRFTLITKVRRRCSLWVLDTFGLR